MGCLAGPVVACAVILSEKAPKGINDSKRLSAKRREELHDKILQICIAHAMGHASVEEIDQLNIYHAGRLAMKRAAECLSQKADFLLIDGRVRIDLELPQRSIIKGDRKSVSIAAASILAKVYRDRWMERLDAEYPGYGFSKHKGYASPDHRKILMNRGPCEIHRKSFTWTPVAS